MGKRNNADGVVGLPDRNTGSGAHHLPDGGVSIRWFIENRLWAENRSSAFDGVGSAYRALSHRRDRKRRNAANRTEHPPSATLILAIHPVLPLVDIRRPSVSFTNWTFGCVRTCGNPGMVRGQRLGIR